MFHLILRDKPSKIFIALKDPNTQWYLSKIAKNTGTTYMFVTHLISNLQKSGFVTLETKGKKRMIKLTEKGEKVANLLEEIKKQFE